VTSRIRLPSRDFAYIELERYSVVTINKTSRGYIKSGKQCQNARPWSTVTDECKKEAQSDETIRCWVLANQIW